jgi:sterol 3beta-glucosyltransferase
MRVAIETLGTRGDVQPYVALAKGLIQQGHDVQLAAPSQFEGFAGEHGVPFAALPGEFLELLNSDEGKAAIAGGKGFSAGFKLLKHVRPMMRRLLEDEWQAVRSYRPDVIIWHPKSFVSPHMATALGVPHILASPLPGFTPTAAFPSPLLPFRSLGPLNRVSHLFATHGASVLFAKDLQSWRVANGLDPRAKTAPLAGTLYAYSPTVLPVPRDWGRDVLVSGYWFLDSPAWTPDAELQSFLDAGDKPLYVGFGSMPGHVPGDLTRTFAEALSRAGKRGIVATGWGALSGSDLPPHLHAIATAPHDRLLPLVSATVHHGGAGTTGASLRAGVPTLLMPFFGDQPFWARRVAELGAGPSPLDIRTLSVDALVAAIRATDEPLMRRRSAEIGAAIREEDGVAAAIAFIEARVGPRR